MRKSRLSLFKSTSMLISVVGIIMVALTVIVVAYVGFSMVSSGFTNEIASGNQYDELANLKSSYSSLESQFDSIKSSYAGSSDTAAVEEYNNARLELTDPNNLLESGVDIVAEPPGKKLQNITLLSGGEKALTAIAILFAILKLRPMPFCLLDEIEAALDDSNVGRFAEYLRRFSKITQFIVITHRKPTMELADCLYGVTMEEKGVSKMVSVQLADALKNVEESK